MADSTHYVIRGGLEGRERLRVLARVMRATTMSLFDRPDLEDGLTCLDVGCGGGDATLELARRVGPRGRVVGIDIDDTKLQLARAEAAEQGVKNVEFRRLDVRKESAPEIFDVVYARFVLTHLSDPAHVVRAFYQHLRPGGRIGSRTSISAASSLTPSRRHSSATTSSIARRWRTGAAIRTSARGCPHC
jgi:2-polyprenyl-3-methyl-5-hydroxy-6-metoxy-1,4-benzoquinol methylase